MTADKKKALIFPLLIDCELKFNYYKCFLAGGSVTELRGDAGPECFSLRPVRCRYGGDGLLGHHPISAAAADAVQATEPAGAMSMASGSLSALGCTAGACVLAVFELLGYGGFLLGDDRQVLACNGVAANVLSASDLSAGIMGGGLILQAEHDAHVKQDVMTGVLVPPRRLIGKVTVCGMAIRPFYEQKSSVLIAQALNVLMPFPSNVSVTSKLRCSQFRKYAARDCLTSMK